MSGANLLVLGGTQAAVDTSVYVEDVFSTYLYTGNGSNQTITNNINLSGKDGLIWWKARSGASSNLFQDTVRGITKVIRSNDTGAETTETTYVTSVSTTGFDVGTSLSVNNTTYATWTFREQAKFFDVVTYTGNGSSTQVINHNLTTTPGAIFIKKTSASQNWVVYHRAASDLLCLNTTGAAGAIWSGDVTSINSTSFTVTNTGLNDNSATYVAYVFAHDAGGFGDAGSDNVISCGSYTGNGADNGPTVSLGYEPQWMLVKRSNDTGGWRLIDNMRGNSLTSQAVLSANLTSSESITGEGRLAFTATGFKLIYGGDSDLNSNGSTYIYIAIRRGPMKTPTSGTSVFDVGTRAGSASVAKTNSNVLTDLAVIKRYTSAAEYWAWTPRLVGNQTLQSNSTDAELTGAMATNPWDTMTGAFCAASNGATNTSTLVDYSFRRAPGFFDVVCYTGTGSGSQTISHNLGAVPELIITRARNSSDDWYTYSATTGNTKTLFLNYTNAESSASSNYWNNTSPTSTQFTAGPYRNGSANYIAYLFASVSGVSKVGSYTGTGTTLQVNCGFTNGSRFVLIKRTDSTGDWYVWDSARGIVAGNDPYLLLNSTAAEVTNTDYVDTYSAGFELSSTAPAGLNANGGSYIFLAIA